MSDATEQGSGAPVAKSSILAVDARTSRQQQQRRRYGQHDFDRSTLVFAELSELQGSFQTFQHAFHSKCRAQTRIWANDSIPLELKMPNRS